MEDFRFENTVQLTESQYVAIWGVIRPRPWYKYIRLAVFIIVGVLCLFSRYTLLIGLILLGLAAMAIFLPRMILPFGSSSVYRRHVYLRKPLTYGVSAEKMWIRGELIDASVKWSMLVTWREVEGWLLLSPSGIPPVYLSLARLREEGLYDRVRDRAARNAPEYNKRKPPPRPV